MSPNSIRPRSMITVGALVGLIGCTPAPLQTNRNADAGGGGGGGGDPDAAPIVGRVTDGLVALYEFDGTTGQSTVSDTSGFGDPLDLTIQDVDAVVWGAGFLTVRAVSLIQSSLPAVKIYSSCSASNELTAEAWIKPASIATSGRIISNAGDATNRNFLIKQQDDTYQARTRTTVNLQGETPQSESLPGTATNVDIQHVVYTRTALGVTTVYVNNVAQTPTTDTGDQTTWDPSYTLTVANEPSADRPWLGDLYLAAVYCRALTPDEVAKNYGEGY